MEKKLESPTDFKGLSDELTAQTSEMLKLVHAKHRAIVSFCEKINYDKNKFDKMRESGGLSYVPEELLDEIAGYFENKNDS